ncbi:MAG TPA: 50S ribosomal protein L15 [Candidatus Saccharimonadales bacterium]|nr:50S ribosomal protein L15 [Candidatus Saccharimonadales bacterium]
MKYNELNIKANKSAKRVGRGIAAGQGKTAGRGTKGQGARTGSSKRPGFAGGQNPLMQKLPKLPGFRSLRTKNEVVYTGQLDQFANKTVDSQLLADNGLISNAFVSVKLLSKGDLTKKVTVKLQAASSTAVEAVEKAGGTFEVVPRAARPKTKAAKEPAKK